MFFTFRQNNSRGVFVENERVGQFVIIEAGTCDEANRRAKSIGIYFNGCENWEDCPCCGDRWDEVCGKGDNDPMIYGEPAKEYEDFYEKDSSCHIHYLDGRHEVIKRKPKKTKRNKKEKV